VPLSIQGKRQIMNSGIKNKQDKHDRTKIHSPANSFRLLILFFIGSAFLFAAQELHAQITSEDCQACHEVKIHAAVHGKIQCLDCHLIKELPHPKPIAKVDCILCHKNMKEMQEVDPHQRARAQGKAVPSCTSCHGAHEMYPMSSAKSVLHPKNIENFCNTCHMNVGYTQIYHVPTIKNEDCVQCHNLTTKNYPPFDAEQFNKSVHNKHFCMDCHRDIKEIPHAEKLSPVNCGGCHKGETVIHKKSVHGKAIAQGINDAAQCWDCHTGHNVLPPTYSDSSVNILNIAGTCGKCHANSTFAKKYSIPIKNPFELYQKSVHLKALINGLNAPTCTNCHGVHNISVPSEFESSIYKGNLPKTCGVCHTKAYRDYTQSQHWRAFLMGIEESPVCNDCHMEHSVVQSVNPQSPVYAKNVAKTCTGCHEAQKVIERYGIASMRLSTYESSYHGLAMRAGNLTAANCSSCHGHHKILPSSDSRSSTNAKNLPATCGQCHPKVSKSIPIGKIHGQSISKTWLFGLVTTIYIYLIVITVGGMVVYCFIDFQKKVRNPEKDKSRKEEHYYIKFNLLDRLFHGIHLIGFIVLVYTGFAHHYPDALWAKPVMDLYGDSVRAIAHRTAGLIIITIFIFQFVVFAFTKYGRKQFIELLPRFKDVSDAVKLLLYNLGIANARPKYKIYNFIEKFEYWALVWGNIIMGLTGFALWFENQSLSIMPKWWLDLFVLIHFYEAVLATLAIVVWHLYWTVFDPEVYPFSRTIWSGKAPVHEESSSVES